MKCPECESYELELLKRTVESSAKQDIEKLLIKCQRCGNVFKENIHHKKPITFRLIVSKFEDSKKTTVDLMPDIIIKIDDVLETKEGQVKINSIENNDGVRVKKTNTNDVKTIWATSLEIPARIGVSVDDRGWISSYKVDLDDEFKINVEDIIKIEDNIFKVNSIKTEERKMRKGYAKAKYIKRIYGKPFDGKAKYDLTKKIVSKTEQKLKK